MIVALLVLATTSTCPRLPPAASAPQNALDIRPDQVKVVAALGDSLTNGFALQNDPEEHR
eukprot:gene13117-30688_t